MNQIMEHRGPDGSGEYIDDKVALGHRRLSIIDISGGAQPIDNEDESIKVIFNGEIYNYIELSSELKNLGHVFTTSSDTEVIVHGYEEWGEECTKHFNGIFAFAIYEQAKNRLFLARDHLGVKPLYYCFTSEGDFIFASEVKSLLEHPNVKRDVDIHALADLFTYRYVPSPRTLFDGISKLPPGHHLTVDKEGPKIGRYWSPVMDVDVGRNEAQATEEYQLLLEDAVRLQMRSDVPVGLFLSEGIDSGSLLAIMSKYASFPIQTFTIGFVDGERTNELEGARDLSKRFGSDHYEMIIGPKDYMDYYKTYIWDIEEPVGNETAAAFYFVSKLASSQVKVALSGQGADEPWGGYHRHLGVKLSSYYSRIPAALSDTMARIIMKYVPKNARLKRAVTSLSEQDLKKRFVNIYSFFSERMKKELFLPEIQSHLGKELHLIHHRMDEILEEVGGNDILNQMLYLDTRTNLPDDLLMVGDKTSMTNSLEMRVPFLDYRLVEFIETLPSNMKIRRLERKYLHKNALRKWLPEKNISKKKKGFANPIDNWLRQGMAPYLEDILLSSGSGVRHYFSRKYIEKLYRLHLEGKEDYYRQLYLLLSFELWHRQFIERCN